jgi:hypothetical protein
MADENVARWQDVLSKLDEDTSLAEEYLATSEELDSPEPAQPWSAPTNLGPVPEELRSVALELLRRQAELEAAYGARLEDVRALLLKARRSEWGQPDRRLGVDFSA